MDDTQIAATNANEAERTRTRMDHVKINERVVVWRVVNGERRRVMATLLKKRCCDFKPVLDGVKDENNELDENVSRKETYHSSKENLEFFVHYDGQDRRLDQWISGDQFIEMAPKNSAGDSGIYSTSNKGGGDTRLTRKRRKNDDELISLDEHGGRGDQHRKVPPEKNIERIIFGSYEIQCWYYSPYRLKKKAVERLYVCENCLLYTDDIRMYRCHLAKDCERGNPPGELIYEEGDVQIYEVFGALQKFYCQRLCLLAKLFIDHKTLCFDVENFIFYLLCETDKDGAHIAAMFSKEMHSSNNLACIMTLPCHQRKGYGNLLIQLSYEMSKRAKYPGTPERPFSDLGEISYKKYWLFVLLEFFDSPVMRKEPLRVATLGKVICACYFVCSGEKGFVWSVMRDWAALGSIKVEDVTVDDLEALVGINKDDIKDTMEPIGLLSHLKGGTYIVHNPKLDQENGLERPSPPVRRLDPKFLVWNPKGFDRPKRRN